jgi:hypothetical protein
MEVIAVHVSLVGSLSVAALFFLFVVMMARI